MLSTDHAVLQNMGRLMFQNDKEQVQESHGLGGYEASEELQGRVGGALQKREIHNGRSIVKGSLKDQTRLYLARAFGE